MHRRSDLLSEIEKVLKLFRLFGFLDSHEVTSQTSKLRFGFIITFLLIAIYKTVTVEILRNYPKESAFYIHSSNHSLNSFSAILPLFYSVFYRKKIASLLHKFKLIDKHFSNFFCIRQNYKNLVKNLMIQLIFFFTLYTAMILFIVFYEFNSRPIIRMLKFYYYVPYTINCVAHLRLSFFMILVASYTKLLRDTFENSRSFIDDKEWTIYRFRNYSRIYRFLWESTQMINEIFSGYIAFAFGNSMIGVIYRGYLFCDRLISSGKFSIQFFIGIIQLMFLMSYTILVSEYCRNIVCKNMFLTCEIEI